MTVPEIAESIGSTSARIRLPRYISSPQDELLTQVVESGLDTSLVMSLEVPDHQQLAGMTLGNGEPLRIIGTLIGGNDGGRVGGFIFNPFHPPSVNRIIEVKSMGGKERHALFPLVSAGETVVAMADYARIGNLEFSRLFAQCFIRLPVMPAIVSQFGLPAEFWSGSAEHPYVQFFVPEPTSHLETVLLAATRGMDLPVMAGSSLNYSGQKSLIERVPAALFSLRHGIPYFDHTPHPDKSSWGSFAIVTAENGVYTIERDDPNSPELRRVLAKNG